MDKLLGEDGAVEEVDNALCEVDQLMEDYCYRFTVRDPRLIERYLNINGEILIEGLVRASGEKLFAVVRARVLGPHLEDHGGQALPLVFPETTKQRGEVDVDGLHSGDDEHDEAVLVAVIQRREDGKAFVSSVGSTIWFEAFDEGQCRRRGSLYVSTELLGEVLLCPMDRKTKMPVLAGVVCSSFAHKVPGEMVQCSTAIVDTVTDRERDILGNVYQMMDRRAPGPRFFVSLAPEGIRVAVAKCLDELFDFSKVFFGPLDLGARTLEHAPLGLPRAQGFSDE